jgi:hypothetical protein
MCPALVIADYTAVVETCCYQHPCFCHFAPAASHVALTISVVPVIAGFPAFESLPADIVDLPLIN